MVLPDVRVRLVDLDSLMDAAAAASAVSEAELGWESSDPLAEMEAVRVGDGGQRGSMLCRMTPEQKRGPHGTADAPGPPLGSFTLGREKTTRHR